jgi:hypothetical protein
MRRPRLVTAAIAVATVAAAVTIPLIAPAAQAAATLTQVP